MSFADLVPALQALSRGDKLQAIQFLASELARAEAAESLAAAAAAYPVWSPHDSHEAARQLLGLLQQGRSAT